MPAAARPHETLTFLVRLWRESDDEGGPQWRGRVEHVASQEVGYIEDGASLIRFIQQWTGDLGASAKAEAGR
ncbi:MAG TPA: hypothetical protein DEP84_16825 [Chloroflexi bacterium]|nr:hypothetical protein [Chloroflexota bacterium]